MPALASRAIATGPISGALPTPPNAFAAQDQVYVVEFEAYDPSTQDATIRADAGIAARPLAAGPIGSALIGATGLVTLRAASHAFTTRPTDNPADTHIDGRLRDAGDVARTMGTGGIPDPRARITFGRLALDNGDGALDTLGNYGLGGRPVTVRRGPLGGQYPYDFAIDYVADIEAVAVSRRSAELRLTDGRRALETPLQETRFAGNNVPPAGLEGGDDLKDQPKPLVYGEVRNIPLSPVNTVKLIYQVSDTTCNSVDALYDAGVALTPAGTPTYSSLADLSNDSLAPSAGQFKVRYDTTGTYVRVGSSPSGQLTADATQGANAAARSAAQLMLLVLAKAGYSATDWVADDFTALDLAENGVCGVYLTTESGAEVMDFLAGSVGAFWGFDTRRRVRVQQFTAPSGTALLSLTDNDLLAFDQLPFLQPSYRTALRYDRTVVVQRDGLAAGATAAHRANVGTPWRETASSDNGVRNVHLLAEDTTEPTALVESVDAAAEASRRQTLRGVLRRRYAAEVRLTDETASLALGDVVSVTSARFGLSLGALMRVTATETDRANARLRLTLYR